MKCEDVLETLDARRDDQDSVEYRRAEGHLQCCELCRRAAHAMTALHQERRAPVPAPGRDAFLRAVQVATAQPTPLRAPASRRSFWLGVSAGGALAAGVALAVVLVWPIARTPAPQDTPTVTAAIDEVRSVDLELGSARAVDDAEIRLVVDGAIELEGYEGYRELSWRTDLDAGANQLSLPVVVRGPAGGQLRVVVRNGARARSFSVNVRASGAEVPVG